MRLNVIKIGGNVINHENKLEAFLTNFDRLQEPSILVHGGGKIATEIAGKLGIKTQMVEGRRLTDKATIDLVTMVYAGKINKKIVASLQSKDTNAMGLSGADGAVVLADKRPVKGIDYGFVGDVKYVNSYLIESLINQDIVPVFAPLSFSKSEGILNTNADTMAAEIAIAMAQKNQVSLTYCFEKNGVLLDVEDESSVIKKMDQNDYVKLKKEQKIFAGMIPKLDNCFNALGRGIEIVNICHADNLLASVEEAKGGTQLVP